MIGVAPPFAAAVSQKKTTYFGRSSHCAISWWKGMGSEGGASFAVKTPGATLVRGAALQPISKSSSRSAITNAEKSSAVAAEPKPRRSTASCSSTSESSESRCSDAHAASGC